MSSDIEPHIHKRYNIKKRIGKGAYGIVWKAEDKSNSETVALKKIFDAFRNPTDAQRTFREIAFLQEFTDHPNIIRLLNVLKAENDKDIYLVFEFMDTDLHSVIKKGNILKDVHKQYIMYQLLKATKYLHSGNVIHRDQKHRSSSPLPYEQPSNVLLDSECFVKLCDFGLARSLAQTGPADESGTDPALTEYVATRWYRAPEILLASQRYTAGVDMWSLGCILAEMILGKPLFPGSSTINQIEWIICGITPPTKQDIQSIGSTYGASILRKASVGRKKSLEEMIPQADSMTMDIIKKLLFFNPEKRLTAEEALKHPYVRRFHNAAEEITVGHDVTPPVDDYVQLTVSDYRNRLYDMIMKKKSERRARRKESRARQRASAKLLSASISREDSVTSAQPGLYRSGTTVTLPAPAPGPYQAAQQFAGGGGGGEASGGFGGSGDFVAEVTPRFLERELDLIKHRYHHHKNQSPPSPPPSIYPDDRNGLNSSSVEATLARNMAAVNETRLLERELDLLKQRYQHPNSRDRDTPSGIMYQSASESGESPSTGSVVQRGIAERHAAAAALLANGSGLLMAGRTGGGGGGALDASPNAYQHSNRTPLRRRDSVEAMYQPSTNGNDGAGDRGGSISRGVSFNNNRMSPSLHSAYRSQDSDDRYSSGMSRNELNVHVRPKMVRQKSLPRHLQVTMDGGSYQQGIPTPHNGTYMSYAEELRRQQSAPGGTGLAPRPPSGARPPHRDRSAGAELVGVPVGSGQYRKYAAAAAATTPARLTLNPRPPPIKAENFRSHPGAGGSYSSNMMTPSGAGRASWGEEGGGRMIRPPGYYHRQQQQLQHQNRGGGGSGGGGGSYARAYTPSGGKK